VSRVPEVDQIYYEPDGCRDEILYESLVRPERLICKKTLSWKQFVGYTQQYIKSDMLVVQFRLRVERNDCLMGSSLEEKAEFRMSYLKT